MAITKIADLNSLYNLIYEDAIFVAREMNLMVGLVKNFSATGYMARKGTIRPQITAVVKAEGDDFQSPTTFGQTLKYTLTPEVSFSQVLLTDEDVQTDKDSAVQDASQELGGSIATKMDVDLITLFASFSAGKGSSGSSLTISNVAAALSVLRTEKAPSPLYIVLHPYGWHDIWVLLGQPAATYPYLQDMGNQALKDFYVGNWMNATWFTSANIAIDATPDAVGACFHGSSLGFDTREAPSLEPERDASRKATELNMSAGYAVGILRDEFGVKLTHDATEPT